MRSSAVGLIVLRGLLFLSPTLCGPASAWAQDPGGIGSRILSMDSWTYEPIERLRSRAYLSGLNPMVQPYRRIDVAAELIGLEPDTLREPVAGWVRMLTRELAPELQRLSPSEDEDRCEDRGGYLAKVTTAGQLATVRDVLGDVPDGNCVRFGAILEAGYFDSIG